MDIMQTAITIVAVVLAVAAPVIGLIGASRDYWQRKRQDTSAIYGMRLLPKVA